MKKNIYCVTDGKIGHIRQSEGLALALKELQSDLTIEFIPAFSIWNIMKNFGRNVTDIQKNSIVIGAGHRTHFALLYYRLKYSVKTVVIMKPSFPKKWFNYCIVPKHDGWKESGNVLVTEGAMNALSLRAVNKQQQAMILIGGPSKACEWQNDMIYQQLVNIIHQLGDDKNVILSTSRRTPSNFLMNLPCEVKERVKIVNFTEVDSTWLPEQLLASQDVWVTEESISMIYEALSAGCNVKTIDVIKLSGKIAKNLDRLNQSNWINKQNNGGLIRLNESLEIAEKLINLGLLND